MSTLAWFAPSVDRLCRQRQHWGVRGVLVSFAILLILGGFVIMAFGLFLFYAWLPFLYGLFGLDIGLFLGKWFCFWHYRRSRSCRCGVFLRALPAPSARLCGRCAACLRLASLLGLNSSFGGLLVIGGGLIGAMIAPKFFDSFIIAASAFGGATLVMEGARICSCRPWGCSIGPPAASCRCCSHFF